MSWRDDGAGRVEALIFDAEGVVVDTEKAWDAAQATLLARRGLAYERERVKPALIGLPAAESIRVLCSLTGLTGDADALMVERDALLRAALATAVRFVAGFEEFHAVAAGLYATVVATSMDVELALLVERALGWSALFPGGVHTVQCVAGIGKPAPDLFMHAADVLGEEPGACVVIEDSPSGIEAARRAGMRCLALTTTVPTHVLARADSVAAGWDQALSVLQAWNTDRCRAGNNRHRRPVETTPCAGIR